MVKAIKNYNCTLPLRLVTENKSINLTDDLIFAGLDTAITNTYNSEIWTNFGKKAAVSAVTTLMGAGVGAVGNLASSAIENTASAAVQSLVRGTISAVGAYTTTVAASYLNAYDFKTGKMDWETANESWYSASTIAGALGAGLTTGLNEYIKLEANFSNDFFASAAKLGVSLAGEAVKYGTHVIYNLASGQGKDSFGNAFDDMGGLTFNLLNLSTIASLFGADDKTASEMKLGLFELQITRDGVSSRIGTNGIDVSGLVYSFASWGGEMLRNAAARNAAERTELTGRMAEEDSTWKSIQENLREHGFENHDIEQIRLLYMGQDMSEDSLLFTDRKINGDKEASISSGLIYDPEFGWMHPGITIVGERDLSHLGFFYDPEFGWMSPGITVFGEYDNTIKNNIFIDIVGKRWALPMTGFGLITGGILTGISKLLGNEVKIENGNNAISFNTGLDWSGAITFGNVIIYAGGDIIDFNKNSLVSRYDNSAQIPLGRHEEMHTHQYQKYGLLMIPALVFSSIFNGGTGAAIKAPSGDAFRAFMERSALERAADDYAQRFYK